MSNVSKRRKEGSKTKIKSVGDHKEFLNRITKTLYYGQLPTLPSLSLPVMEVSCAAWSAGAAARGRSLRRLHADAAARVARQACVSPCALVLALLYLERLNACNKDYLANMHPQDLFLVSLMVGNKFLQDDGEDDEVICSEWAASGGIDLKELNKLEMEFLNAIDWNVFVSDASFEAGLSRLERAVALRQARARGFFTYCDLAAAGAGGAAELARAAAACAALSLAYVTGLLALLSSALLAAHAGPPALQLAARLVAPAAAPTPAPPPYPGNNASLGLTVDALAAELLAEEVLASERLRCCAGWARFAEPAPRVARPARIATDARRTDPWRSRTSVWTWLYRSSLVDPMQRWLERMDEYADVVTRMWNGASGSAGGGGCGSGWSGAGECGRGRGWLPLGALLTLSDR